MSLALEHTTCPESFRNAVLDRYVELPPGTMLLLVYMLKNSLDGTCTLPAYYMCYLYYLDLNSRMKDKVISHKMSIEQCRDDFLLRRGKQLSFRANMFLPVAFSKLGHGRRIEKAASVTNDGKFRREVIADLEMHADESKAFKLLLSQHRERRVEIVSGLTREESRKLNNAKQFRHGTTRVVHFDDEPIATVLNRIDASWLTPAPARILECQRWIDETFTSKAQRQRQHAILHACLDYPVPTYFQRGAMSRLFAIGASYQIMPSTMRTKLIPDLIELDLRSAHMAILASNLMLNFPEVLVRQFLSGSIWQRFLAYVPKLVRDKYGDRIIKDNIKELSYSVLFGKAKDAAIKSWTGDYPRKFPTEFLEAFFDDELMKMFVARVWKRISLYAMESNLMKYQSRAYAAARSRLSKEAQRWETVVIREIYRLAKLKKFNRLFQIVLHSHDGVTIRLTPLPRNKPRDPVPILQAIWQAVDRVLRALGIPSALTWELPESATSFDDDSRESFDRAYEAELDASEDEAPATDAPQAPDAVADIWRE